MYQMKKLKKNLKHASMINERLKRIQSWVNVDSENDILHFCEWSELDYAHYACIEVREIGFMWIHTKPSDNELMMTVNYCPKCGTEAIQDVDMDYDEEA